MSGAARSAKPAIVSTHISHVILLGDLAIKVKRPVKFPFLDLSTVQRREDACEKEVRLNRRLAGDVYLGVGRFIGPDDREEPVVVMRRLPEASCLRRVVEEGAEPGTPLAAIAHKLAAFHGSAETSEAIARHGLPSKVRGKWEANLRETERFIGSFVTAARHRGIALMSSTYLAGRAPLFRERIDAGRIRDGHGDVKADDIFCLEDGPRILDCLEFDDDLRYIDVFEDVASLMMDLERLGRPDLAQVFGARYERCTDDRPPKSLKHHYIAYRALVRAKVAAIGAGEGRAGAAEEAKLLFALAHTHLARGTVRLVLVGGLPGTGKTSLSRRLCEAQGWTMLSSDAIRREIFDMAGVTGGPGGFGEGVYDRSSKERVYAEMLDRARHLLERGESVVLDASWNAEHDRIGARRVAEQTSSLITEVRCSSSFELADARMRLRRFDATSLSEATPEVARRMAGEADPWPESVVADTSGDLAKVADDLLSGPLSRPQVAADQSGSGVARELVADRT